MRDQRFRLVTLGGLALRAPDGADEPTLARRRRKLAVLAVLALARRPVPRDHLVALFWGEQEEARARHSLSDALSHLRRVLGPGAITTRDAEVALSPDAPLAVDALEVAGAADAGDAARVIACYGGPFLDGVRLAAGADLEHWADAERARLAATFVRACADRCPALARARRWDECTAVARRWLDAAPLSADAALFLLNALKAPGTRDADAAALAEYERLRARLHREFEVEPEASVAGLAASIATRLATPPVAETPASAPAPAPPAVAEPPVAAPVAGAAAGAAPVAPPRRRVRRWIVGWAAALLAAAGVTALATRRAPAVPVSATAVAVLPFTVRGAAEYDYLGEGMVHLLSATLDGAGLLRGTDPRAVLGAAARAGAASLAPDGARTIATRLGAGLYVLGDVLAAGGRVRITATLYEPTRRAGPIARASVEGAPDELFALVDALTAQLLAGRAGARDRELDRVAAATTTSLPALKAYLVGESHYRANRYAEAFDAFQRAIAADSTFALAHYRASQTGNWSVIWPWDSLTAASARAVRHGDRLTRRARLVVGAFHAYRIGDYDAAERLYRQIVAAHPDDVEAWYHLGEVLFHFNTFRGRSLAEARAPFERVLELEPDHRGALTHLLRVAMWERRADETAVLLQRTGALTPPELRPELRALQAYALGDARERDAALAGLREASDEMVRISAVRVGVYAGSLDGAERIARLLVEPHRRPDARAVGHVYLAELAAAGGRRRDADAHLAAAARDDAALALEHRAMLLALPFLDAPASEIAAVRAALDAWDGTAPPHDWPSTAAYNAMHPALRLYLSGVASARLDDVAAAARAADALDRLDAGNRELARGLAASLRGHAAARRGDAAAALAAFDRGRLTVVQGMLETTFGSQAYERWARAELLRELGRDDEALRWYATIADVSVDQLVYLAPAHLRQAEIHDRHGRPAEAAAHYQRFVELWRDCDPELRPLVEAAERRLRALGD